MHAWDYAPDEDEFGFSLATSEIIVPALVNEDALWNAHCRFD
jgi:hypothetical protein